MICRLCLKEIPEESCIKLYENVDNSIEMVKLIDKYLEINVSNIEPKKKMESQLTFCCCCCWLDYT